MYMRKIAAGVAFVLVLSAGSHRVAWACCGGSFGPLAQDNGAMMQDFSCPTCAPDCSTASPVFVKTGNYTYRQVDLALSGRGPLVAAYRTYNSQDSYIGPVGTGWHHSLIIQAVRMVADNGEFVLVRLPSAMRVLFTSTGGSYESPLGHYEVLREVGDGRLELIWPSGESWVFATDGWIETITDRNGNTATWAYSTVGGRKRPASVTGAGGQRLDITWGSAGRIASIIDQAGRRVSYQFDMDANLQQVEDIAGRTWSYEYRVSDSRALLEAVKLEGTTYASAVYDTTDRVISYMEDARTWTVEYQEDHTIKRDASGNEWRYVYDSFGVVTKRTDPTGAVRDITYYPDYLRQSVALEDGTSVEFENGQSGRVGAITRREGEQSWTWSFGYASESEWALKWLPAGIRGPAGWGGATFDYDASGNLMSASRFQQDGTTEDLLYTFERNAYGDVTAATDAAGARTEFVYNGNGQLIQLRLPANNTAGTRPVYQFGYDLAGRVNGVTDPAGRVTTAVYDALGRPTQVTLPDPGTGASGFTRTWTYDEVVEGGLKSTATDLNGVVTSWIEDVWGNTKKVTNASGGETTITWADGVPVEVADANRNTTYYQYDELHRLKKVLHPEGTSTEYTYTPIGQVATRKDRKNQTATFGYDALTRLVSGQYGDGSISYEYSGALLATVRDSVGGGGGERVTSYVYDASQRLASVTNDRGTVEYAWLPGDRLAGYRIGSGPWVNYGYYASGDVWTIQRDGDPAAFEYTYALNGERESLQYPNGSHVDYTWDNLGRLLTLTNSDAASNLISRYSYAYDTDWATGQFTKKGLAVSMTEDLPAGTTGVEKYYFDALYQLTRADYPDGSRSEWTYDSLGNRLSASSYPAEGDPVIRSYAWFPNGQGANSQLLQSDGVNAYTWDANGNMLTKTTPDGISYYTWDSLNRLDTIAAPYLNASYTYDSAGRRTRKTVNGVESAYQYAGWDLVSETSGTETRDYIFGADIDEILNMRIGGSTDYFYHTDALGSIRQVYDAAGTIANSYQYDVWGEIRYQQVTVPNVFLFTGREAGEDGLLGYRFRYYQPSIGSFISEDPLRFAAGDPSFYRYVFANPVNGTDPSGLLTVDYMVGDVWIPMGELAGQEALDSYGDIIADPNASALAKGGAYVGGFFAALWTPCTSDWTFTTLTAAYGASKALITKGAKNLRPKQGIYEFLDKKAGKKYVGQSGDIPRRLQEHLRAGRLDPSDATLKTKEVLGGKLAREIAEQQRINQLGGIDNLANKVNPIGPARQHLMPPS